MSDIIIIGAGPAGMTAAIYALRAGKTVTVFDRNSYGGQMMLASEVENYPGIKHIGGAELSEKMREHAAELGAEFVFGDIVPLELAAEEKVLLAGGKEYRAKAVIIANGSVKTKLKIDGEERLLGSGVSYCATCDGNFFKGKDTVVVGGTKTAVEDALYLSDICKKVTLVTAGSLLKGAENKLLELEKKENIEILYKRRAVKILGEKVVSGLEVTNAATGENETIDASAVFIAVGTSPTNEIFEDILRLDEKGYIIAGEDCKTGIDGVFVAGDARTKPLRQVATAVADGAVAGNAASKYVSNH